MYRPVHVVEVLIWGKAVGAVALDPKLGYYAFEYLPAFRESGIDLAPITMPIPAGVEPSLTDRIEDEPNVSVLVHGLRHANHAPPGAAKAEFGPEPTPTQRP